jgi:imidazolonepropionase-like amidohydrolase
MGQTAPSQPNDLDRPMIPSRLISLALVCACSASSLAQGSLVITDVTVIDGTGAAGRPNSAVIITGNRIDSIVDARRRAAFPKGARVIQATGKFVIPGLWDMHVHLSAKDLPLFVAHGVTGVRDMGNRLSDVDSWRAQIAGGTVTGPTIVRVGPILNGQVFGPTHVQIRNESEARAAVQVLKHVGVDAIKLHKMLSREAYLGLSDEARKSGIPFVGHIPQTVTAQEASDAGQASFEHMETLFEGGSPLKREDAPALFERFVRNGNAYTPTLVNYRGSADPANIDPELLRQYPDIPAGRSRIFQQFLEFLGLMNEKGVTLMTGTDLGSKWISPGSSLHDELAIFVEAGLTPMQALQAGTRNPARFLHIDAGTLEPGRAANLVLLDANPLDDIRNTARIRAVVLNGRFLDKPQLQRLALASRAK